MFEMIPEWNKKSCASAQFLSEEAGDSHPAGHSYSWSSYFTQDKGGRFPDTNTGLKKAPSPRFFLEVPAEASEQKEEVKQDSRSLELREEFVTLSYPPEVCLVVIWKLQKYFCT